MPFAPGLVGGHCIGVDPYYLSYRGQMLGHDPQVILAGRSINDDMGRWVADRLHEELGMRRSRILVLGLTFKENVPDLRNSKVADVVARLTWLGHEVTIHDPHANPAEAQHEYGLMLSPQALAGQYDAVFAAVPHEEYCALDAAVLSRLVAPEGVVFDLKRVWPDLASGSARLEGLRRYCGI
jgi:UDP-N-acetyl-D-galactosamine dehydrogenase